MSLLLALVIAAVILLLSVTVVLLVVGPTILLQPRRRTAVFYKAIGQPTTPSDLALTCEEINIPVGDHVRLNCWFIASPAPARGTVIYLHGVADCKIDGLRLAKLLHDNRYHVLLYDARRHGNSDGVYCTYGFHEKHDLLKLIDYLQARSDVASRRVGLFGTSMGAAVAIQAAALDGRIAAVVAENGFATLRSVFDDYQKRMIKLPFHYLRNLVIKRSELVAGFKANDVSPLDVVGDITIPILFIYGGTDRLINHDYTLRLYERKAGDKEIFPIPAAGHGDTWLVAGREYEKRVLSFFGRTLE